MTTQPNGELVALTAQITAAYVGGHNVGADAVPGIIDSVYGALARAGAPAAAPHAALQPAVPIRSSVKPDYIVCLEDGCKLKMMKRHLAAAYGMSPAQYRAKWGLPPDYPMVAPNYTARRSELAKKIGLGRAGLPTSPVARGRPRKAA